MSDKIKDLLSKIEVLTVVEMAELVKAMEEKFGISAAMPMASGAGAAAGAAADDEKTSFDVVLKAGGEQKIQVIKVLREVLGVGLTDAKALDDTAPKPVKTGMSKADAEELKKKLETAGATVELK